MSGRRDAEGIFLLAAIGTIAFAALTSRSAQHRPVTNYPSPVRTDAANRAALAQIATENGRGRRATSPIQIPRKGWKDIAWRVYVCISEDRLLATAAGVVFFGLLAVFPTITALVSSYALFADPATIGDNLRTLSIMLPAGSYQIVEDQVVRVLAKGNTSLGFTFAFSLLLALWSANAGMKAIIDALNVAYKEREKRSFIGLTLLSLTLTICGIVALLVLVSSVVALPLALNHLGLENESKLIISLSRWPLMLVGLLAGLGILYRFGPSREAARWQWLSIGALAAALLWIAGSSLLSWYLSNFGDYDATYGSLGAAIGLMTWMWMSAIVILLGAEINSEIEHQTITDTTTGAWRPIGVRGAVVADTLGKKAGE